MKTKSGSPFNLREMVKAASAAIDSIKLNKMSGGRYRGRRLRVKRRRESSEYIASVANMFFPLANAPISVCADPAKWQRWEITCYQLLNGDKYVAYKKGSRTV